MGSIAIAVTDDEDRIQARRIIDHYETPFTLTAKHVNFRRKESKNRLLNAHLRDIARWKYGEMTVPDRVFETVVDDFKRTDIWPRYDNPEPDVFTGEVLYRSKSRSDLTDEEIKGIVQWLEHFMSEKHVKSHAPEDNWQA